MVSLYGVYGEPPENLNLIPISQSFFNFIPPVILIMCLLSHADGT